MYRLRFAVPEDVPACVAMSPTTFACFDASSRRWWVRFLHGRLVQGRALAAVVVDSTDRPVAFGVTMFISDQFRQRLIQNSYPMIGQTLRLWAEKRDILTSREILNAHRGEGLNLLGFYGWRSDLSEDSLALARHLLWMSFPWLHRGYHLKSFLKEVYGEEEAELYQQLGLRIYKTPESYGAQRRFCPYLVGVERYQVRISQRTADLFQAEAPTVWLTHKQRLIAQLGYILNLSNAQIAECLNCSVNTVYVHWNRLCRRVGIHSATSREGFRRGGRQELLRHIPSQLSVIYPLNIHTMCYHHPEIASRYPIPLPTPMPTAAVSSPQPEPASHQELH